MKNKIRENRIIYEIIVDAYDEYERAAGWYCYLADTMTFPFTAKCNFKRAISSLKAGDEVEIVDIASQEDCDDEMFVMMKLDDDCLPVSLSQLEVISGDDKTKEAVADWNYWTDQGYCF